MGLESMASDHPIIAGIFNAVVGNRVDGHGFIRSALDGIAGYEVASGNAGFFSKLDIGEEAREAAIEGVKKVGGGWLMQQFAGIAAGMFAYHEAGVISDDIKKAKESGTSTPEKTPGTSSTTTSLLTNLVPGLKPILSMV
jgi:hypothetical protein